MGLLRCCKNETRNVLQFAYRDIEERLCVLLGPLRKRICAAAAEPSYM